MTRETATFATGCFWCSEPIFRMLKGVKEVTVGYAGGEKDNPTYEEVSSGQTGHAEVARVTYDADVITYEQLLDIFFYIHDPTQLNRQGADAGTQYRTAIFYESAQQRKKAEEALAEAKEGFNLPAQAGDSARPNGYSSGRVVTTLEPLKKFWPAEEYHQRYFEKNPAAGYCQVVVEPKIERFKKTFNKLIAS